MGDTCPAQTRFRPAKYDSNHTVTCQKPAGHDGGHEWKRDARTVIWHGEAKKVEDNTRLRFGRWLEDK